MMQSIDLKDSETFNFYDSGMTDGSRPHRVGLLLDPIAASSPISGQPVSARISDLGLEGQISNVTLLSAYAPIRDSPDDSKDAFYFELQRILDFVPGHNILFVAGGFKSRVCKSDTNTKGVISRHTIRHRCLNGESLLQLAKYNKRCLVNIQFEHRKLHLVTWRSNDGDTKA